MVFKINHEVKKLPNMRLQPTAQLAAKNHADQSRFPRKPAQKYRIIQIFVAPAIARRA
jgi:hypothetical protein